MMKDIYKHFRIICIFMVCAAFWGCIPEEIELPCRVISVTTSNPVNIASEEVTLLGKVTLVDTFSISCGVIYDTSSKLSSKNGTMKYTDANGDYSIRISGLKANTTYYYRAYAVDAGKYKYGSICSFKTGVSVVTGNAIDVTYSSATLGGTVNSSNKSLTCGIIYGTSSTLSSTSGTKKSTTSSGEFSVSVTGLSAKTTYYYRAYAIIDGEYIYGEVRSFNTAQEVAVITGEATAITYHSATLGGMVNNSEQPLTCGIIYAISSSSLTLNGTVISTTSSGAFSVNVIGLSPNTTYYYCAYAVVDGKYKYGEILSFTTETIIVGDAIDLGLSVKWASCNVGAKSPEDYGGYYAWGETEEKDCYVWNTYKFGSYDYVTKYCTNSDYGTVDNKITLDPEDDVAHVLWGDGWRMPTWDEMGELFEKCTFSWTSVNGVKCYKATGPNGNYILFPAAGSREDMTLYKCGEGGDYWSNTLYYWEGANQACHFNFGDTFGGWEFRVRYVGRSVRPVYGTPRPSISVTTGDATDITDSGATLSGTVDNSDKSVTCGIIYDTSSTLSSTSGTMESTSSSGEFSIDVTGLSPNTTYYYCAYVVVDGEYQYGEVLSFTTESITVTSGDAIDLGLSVKWASCNVGVESPEEYGGYYAWGETEEKTDYSRSTYKWNKGNSYTKYSSDIFNDFVDNKTSLDLEDDVAHVKRGGSWRMPTMDEIIELRDRCSFIWTSINGVRGYKVIGPNGNSIFLPAAGYRSDEVIACDYDVSYLSSTLVNEEVLEEIPFLLHVTDHMEDYYWYDWCYSYYRFIGHTVRPVYDDSRPSISVTTGEATDITDGGATLGGTISNSDKSLTCGIIYGTSSTLSSTSGTMLSTTSSGEFSVSVTGLSASTTYYYCAYVVVDGEYKYGEVRSFTTEADISITVGEAVDLGLSVKWASCNVGATAPEEYGGYYAWGETTTKSSYSSDNSVTYGLSISELESRGIIDAAGNLTAAYDAATANRGDKWRMPTLDEMTELSKECKWEWTKMNGVNGYKVTGPNGNSIFLPAAGFRYATELRGAGFEGYYWSATPERYWSAIDSGSYAYYLLFLSGDLGCYESSCYSGLTVRPVTDGKRNNSDVDLDGYPEDENWDARRRR